MGYSFVNPTHVNFRNSTLLQRRNHGTNLKPYHFKISASYQSSTSSPARIPIGLLPPINPLGVGTWSWGNRILFDYDPSQDGILQSTFNEAVSIGAEFFDTADSYGTGSLNGRSESLLGRFLEECPYDTSRVRIATKVAPFPWRLIRGSIRDAALRSAERLKRPADILQAHWSPRGYAPWQEKVVWDGLADALEAGACKYVGVSNYGPKHLKRVVDYLSTKHGITVASAQTQLSLLQRQPIQDGFLDVARSLNIAVIGYSPLCLGLLTGKYKDKRPKGVRGLLFNNLKVNPLVEKLMKIGERFNATAGQVAIAWCLRQGVIVIAGMRTPEMAIQNMEANRLVEAIPNEVWKEIESIANEVPGMIANSFQTD